MLVGSLQGGTASSPRNDSMCAPGQSRNTSAELWNTTRRDSQQTPRQVQRPDGVLIMNPTCRHPRLMMLAAAALLVCAGLHARPAAQARGAQSASAPPAYPPGPSGPYNPRDIAAARPFGEPARAEVARALKGSIDIHMHTDPDIAPRPVDAIEVVKLAKSYGLRAIVLKNHYESTAAQAYLMRKIVPGIEIFGAITMDLTNGGVNPAAVEHMAKLKGGYGKVVWFPTYDSEASARNAKPSRPFARVSKDGVLTPESKEVISIVAKYGLTMATGHVSPEEGLLLISESRGQGVQRMVVTHAMDDDWTVPQMQEAARMGAFIEFAKPVGGTTVAEYADGIRKVGPAFCIVSETGVSFLPAQLVGAFLPALRAEGFTEKDLEVMMKINPAKLLGLPVQ